MHGDEPSRRRRGIKRTKDLPFKLGYVSDIEIKPIWLFEICGVIIAGVQGVRIRRIQHQKISVMTKKGVAIPYILRIVAAVAIRLHQVVIENKGSWPRQGRTPIQQVVVVALPGCVTAA